MASFRSVISLVLTLGLGLAACNSAGDPPDDTAGEAPVRHAGLALLTTADVAGARIVSAHANFGRSAAALDDVTPAPFGAAPDTCRVASARGGSESSDPPRADAGRATIGAGTSLVVRHAGEAYATLGRVEDGSYTLEGGAAITTPLPSGDLTLAIPGGEFPSFDGVPFPRLEAVELDADVGPFAVDADTTFAWTPGEAADARVLLIGGGTDAVFSCVVADDGSFGFDSASRDALAAEGFVSGTLGAVGRLSLVSHREGDALLTLGVLHVRALDSDPTPGPATAGITDPAAGAAELGE